MNAEDSRGAEERGERSIPFIPFIPVSSAFQPARNSENYPYLRHNFGPVHYPSDWNTKGKESRNRDEGDNGKDSVATGYIPD